MHRLGARRSGASLLLAFVLMAGGSPRVSASPIQTEPAPMPSVSWPMFHFDAANTGFNPFESELGPSNVGGLAPAWSHSVRSTLMASPVMDHGVVYVETKGEDIWEGTLKALRAEDGSLVWRQPTYGPGGWHCIAAGHGAVYVAALDGPTVSRWLHAFDGTTGVERWTAPGPSRSATAAGGRVFGSTNEVLVLALDPRDGGEIWRAYPGNVPGNLAVAGALAFAVSNDGNAFAFDRSTGALVWEQEAVSPIGSPAIAAGTVFLGTFEGLAALEASSGEILWESEVGTGSTLGTPAIANGVVYFLGSDALYALRARTGNLLWSAPVGDQGLASPSVANGVVYTGSLIGTVHAFQARTGEELWRYNLGVSINTAPAIVDGTLYVAASPLRQGHGQRSVLTAFRLPE
jgi:outer membrane protein assembly factor BamB